MDAILPYESLLFQVKSSLNKDVQKESKNASFYSELAKLLEDCSSCVTQSLSQISTVLDKSPQLSKIKGYLEDVICLLKQLSDYIKSTIEHIVLSCGNIQKVPVVTGQIILTVFSHCKDSESTYGPYLSHIQQQLKELFRTCHELQLTYLLLLGRHYVFDVSDEAALDVLVEVISLNLSIGETVQTLDVKTLAEQWKGCLALCERYGPGLRDSRVYGDSCTVLCAMVVTNISTALEPEQDQKVLLRCLKIASFTLKVLLKMHNIFRDTTQRDLTKIVELLVFIYNCPGVHPDMQTDMVQLQTQMLTTNVTAPTEALLDELSADQMFFDCLLHYKPTTSLLGYILLVSRVTNTTEINRDMDRVVTSSVIEMIISMVPRCYPTLISSTQLHMGLLPPSSLYNYLLYNAVLLCATFDTDQFAHVERCLYGAVLGEDCLKAEFAHDLWMLLARLNSSTLVDQLTHLCKTYNRLQTHPLYPISPQRVHLTYTMTGLFQMMNNDQKLLIFNKFSVQDENNANLWSILNICKLPKDCKRKVERVVCDKMMASVNKVFDSGTSSYEDIVSLTKTINIASTCTFDQCYKTEIKQNLVRIWMKLCPLSRATQYEEVTRGNLWFFEFLKALVKLTGAVRNARFVCDQTSEYFKIVHVISRLLFESSSTDVKLLLVNVVCDLLKHYQPNQNRNMDRNLKDVFIKLLQDKYLVRNKFLLALKNNKTLRLLITKITHENISDNIELESQKHEIDAEFRHKCISKSEVTQLDKNYKSMETNSNNFEFADIDSLLGDDNDSEPVYKKMKMSDNVEEIIEKLQKDVGVLWRNKENISRDFKDKLESVIEQLTVMKNYLN